METEGLRKLRAWMAQVPGERSQGKVAMLLGISQVAVGQWIRARTRPEQHHRVLLERLTGIPADAWYSDKERRAMDRRLPKAAGV